MHWDRISDAFRLGGRWGGANAAGARPDPLPGLS
jgi:hypothetical protein